MLVTSKDLFWLVLSFVILWIGIFAGWGVYYLAMILRDIRSITSNLRRKFNLIDQILETIKKKVESTANYLPPLIEAGGKLVQAFKEKKNKKKK